jgi:hypothetical protein
MYMFEFRVRRFVEGFIKLAEGLVQIVSCGFWLPSWSVRWNLREFLSENAVENLLRPEE